MKLEDIKRAGVVAVLLCVRQVHVLLTAILLKASVLFHPLA